MQCTGAGQIGGLGVEVAGTKGMCGVEMDISGSKGKMEEEKGEC